MHVLLIITGSVAAYKALELVRLLREKQHEVTCVLTKGAQEFITPLSCASLSENKAYTHLFDLKDETEMGHIRLSRQADMVLVLPASADFLAKMAHGIADDLASTLILASNKPVWVVPAMNHEMWKKPATQRNVTQLQADGVTFIGPDSGELACGEQGVGRMAELTVILEHILAANKERAPLHGYRALVTSGPTREAIDPVRYISNQSSGKQGYAVAKSLAALGAEVTLISGPTHLAVPDNVTRIEVESALEMLEACRANLPVDIAVCAAAVADWRTNEVAASKIKKSKQDKNLTFTFAENPDILYDIGHHSTKRPKLVVGFAAETEHVVENAQVKREQKGCDWIVANDVSGGAVFNSDDNTVHLITPSKHDAWPTMEKTKIAEKLGEAIVDFFAKND